MSGADKLKGLLKGLRYISNIFEPEDKEAKMKIGFPTDVKHVAHVGWDDHSMNEFKLEPGNGTVRERNGAGISPKSYHQDAQRNGEVHTSFNKDLTDTLPKSSQSNPSSSSANPTSHRDQHSRRHHSSSTNTSDRDKSESSRRGRRERNLTDVTQNETLSSSSSSSSALQDQSVVSPKQARRRKAKGSSSSSGTSSRSSRSKEQQLPLPKPTGEEEEEN